MSICNTCQVCLRRVQSFSYSIDCKTCFVKYHIKCVNINRDDVIDNFWYCPHCVQEIFPFNHFDNDEDFYSTIMEGVIECPCRLHEISNKQRVLMHGHQGWNVRHGLCHIYMIYVYIWVVYSFCLFCCLFIIVTTQFVALYKPCKPKPKPSTYDPPDNHPLAEIQRPILRPEPKQQICHQHANTDHFGK